MNQRSFYLNLTKNLAVLTLASVSTFAFSAPQILNIQGELKQDSTLVIEGANFGTLSKPLHQLWDTVGNQSVFRKLPDGAIVPTDKGPWTGNGNPWSNPTTIYRGADQRHSHSAANYQVFNKGYLGWPRKFENNANRKFYASWWFKPNMSPDAHGGHNKLIRVWDDSSGKFTRISWTNKVLGAYKTPSGGGPDDAWRPWGGKVNEWNRNEIYVDSDKHTIKTWVNGKLTHSSTQFQKQDSPMGLTIGLVGFDPNVAERYKDFEFKMDEIYASSVPARVELSTSKTWSAAGNKKELQPFKSWQDIKVEISVNLGQFSESDDLYVYVVDSDGVVNKNGVKLNPHLCKNCPGSPLSFKVQ